MAIHRADTGPHGVETPIPTADCWLAGIRGASATLAGQGSILRSLIFPYMYYSNKLGRKTVVARVEYSPYCVETTTPGTPPVG